ncbi:MAG: hypothetical protein HS111_03230 [Kofleriaceae bacterium]|nr:hypothetical protein [Kofleriaceae bacterium]
MAWGGACSGGTCSVTMTQDRTVTANFKRTDKTLTVTVSGTGTGTVTSVPAGINARPTAARTYAHGTSVTLTASPTAATSDFRRLDLRPVHGQHQPDLRRDHGPGPHRQRRVPDQDLHPHPQQAGRGHGHRHLDAGRPQLQAPPAPRRTPRSPTASRSA